MDLLHARPQNTAPDSQNIDVDSQQVVLVDSMAVVLSCFFVWIVWYFCRKPLNLCGSVSIAFENRWLSLMSVSVFCAWHRRTRLSMLLWLLGSLLGETRAPLWQTPLLVERTTPSLAEPSLGGKKPLLSSGIIWPGAFSSLYQKWSVLEWSYTQALSSDWFSDIFKLLNWRCVKFQNSQVF